jgi:hypothetical protein
MEPMIRFVDSNGTPVSHEAVNAEDYTEGMKLEGQGVLQIKLKDGYLGTTFRCVTYQEFCDFGKILFNEIKRENDRGAKTDKM